MDGQTSGFTYRMKTKQVSYESFLAQDKVLKRNEQGEPTWILGTSQDIHPTISIGRKSLTADQNRPLASCNLKDELYELVKTDRQVFDLFKRLSPIVYGTRI